MLSKTPLSVSQLLLATIGMQMFIYHENRIPQDVDALIVVSNHRSFMDAPILIQALRQPVRIACHHYMSQTPVLREFVQLLGCLPLDEPQTRQKHFFEQANQLLNAHQWVGIFPEGASPMIQLTEPKEVKKFNRGFAHLALRAQVQNLAVLPIAIASLEETITSPFPLRLLSLFDPSEPLFKSSGLHPMAIYHRTNVLIGRPYWITDEHRQQYRGKEAKQIVSELSDYCHQEITQLLQVGCF
jgi:1-acyl-sn-glycerol-3-phosphate acyltransferase